MLGFFCLSIALFSPIIVFLEIPQNHSSAAVDITSGSPAALRFYLLKYIPGIIMKGLPSPAAWLRPSDCSTENNCEERQARCRDGHMWLVLPASPVSARPLGLHCGHTLAFLLVSQLLWRQGLFFAFMCLSCNIGLTCTSKFWGKTL